MRTVTATARQRQREGRPQNNKFNTQKTIALHVHFVYIFFAVLCKTKREMTKFKFSREPRAHDGNFFLSFSLL